MPKPKSLADYKTMIAEALEGLQQRMEEINTAIITLTAARDVNLAHLLGPVDMARVPGSPPPPPREEVPPGDGEGRGAMRRLRWDRKDEGLCRLREAQVREVRDEGPGDVVPGMPGGRVGCRGSRGFGRGAGGGRQAGTGDRKGVGLQDLQGPVHQGPAHQ
jgi:hypothetical protein